MTKIKEEILTSLTEEDLEIFDSSIGFNRDKQFSIEITRLKREDLELIKSQILECIIYKNNLDKEKSLENIEQIILGTEEKQNN